MGERVAVYCRLSVEDGDLENGDVSESIKNQRLMLTDYARAQGWTIHEIYCDEDLKGFDRERPQFKRMLKGAENGEFDIILCKHQSRFTRDMELVEKYINGRFILWGIRFVSLTDHVDTNIKGNKKARQINGLINEWYSEDLSENIRAVFRKKMEDGQFIGSFTAYGYQKSAEDKHKIIIDEEAAVNVREIYRLYLAGFGAVKIADELTRRGIPTPSAYKAKKGYRFSSPNSEITRRYNVWSPGTVKRILSSELYTGTLIQGREKKVSYKSKKRIIRPKEEWIVIENNHPPVIDKKTFEEARRIAGNNRRTVKKAGEVPAVPNIFGGRLKCRNCGGNLQRSGVSRDGRTVYYRCSTGARTKGAACSSQGIRQDKVEEIITGALECRIQTYLSSQSSRTEIINGVLDRLGGEMQEKRERELKGLAQKLEHVDLVLARAYGDKILGNMTAGEYENCKKVFLEEKIQLEKRINQLVAQKALLQENTLQIRVEELLDGWKEKLNSEMVGQLIQLIEIGDKTEEEREICITWKG